MKLYCVLLVVVLCCTSKLQSRTAGFKYEPAASQGTGKDNSHELRKRSVDPNGVGDLVGALGNVIRTVVSEGGKIIGTTSRSAGPILKSVKDIVGTLIRSDFIARSLEIKRNLAASAPRIVGAKVGAVSSIIQLKLALVRQLQCLLLCPRLKTSAEQSQCKLKHCNS